MSVAVSLLGVGAGIAAMVVLLQLLREDLQSKLVSARKCYVFIALCLLAQFCVNGISCLFIAMVWTVLVVAVCAGMNFVHAKRYRNNNNTPSFAIGSGDVLCMIGLCLLGGEYTPIGVVCCCCVTGLFALVGLLSRCLQSTDTFPFVPFLFVWFVPVFVLTLQGSNL